MGRQYNKKLSFSRHLSAILDYARGQGMKKGELCKVAGLRRKRWSDFVSGRKNFTAYYFLKIIGGLGLSLEKYEEVTGMRFTKKERNEFADMQFCNAHREVIEDLSNRPELFQALMKLRADEDLLKVVNKVK